MPVDPITQAAVMGMKYVAAYLMAASRCDSDRLGLGDFVLITPIVNLFPVRNFQKNSSIAM